MEKNLFEGRPDFSPPEETPGEVLERAKAAQKQAGERGWRPEETGKKPEVDLTEELKKIAKDIEEIPEEKLG